MTNLMPLALPPGVWKNGTRQQAKNRYFETNLVRWSEGVLRAVGGWALRTYLQTEYPPITDPAVDVIRDGHAWNTNDKSSRLVLGSNAAAWWIKDDGTYDDISPAGLTLGPNNPATFRGYGTGPYGREAYGVRRSSAGDGQSEPVGRWSMDNWGENLLAKPDWLSGATDVIYEWTPDNVGPLVPIANCPTGFVDFVVTKDLIVMGIGNESEARRVHWSDQENNTEWDIDDVTNQAGQFTLAGSGSMISIHNVNKTALILTKSDAWAARYIGPPYVQSFTQVGLDCAPVHRNFVATTNSFAMWLGEQNFWVFDGSSVKELPCDLIDWVSEVANAALYSKAYTWTNGDFTEVWFHFVSNKSDGGSTGECDAYFKYDWVTRSWDHGYMNRSHMIGTPILADVHGVDHAAQPYWHELVGILPDNTYAVTGPLELGAGDNNLAIRRVLPDVETPPDEKTWDELEASGGSPGTEPGDFGVDVQFMMRDMPTGQVRVSPLYALRNPTSVMVLGRDVSMKISGRLSGWEVGNFRFDIAGMGTGSR